MGFLTPINKFKEDSTNKILNTQNTEIGSLNPINKNTDLNVSDEMSCQKNHNLEFFVNNNFKKCNSCLKLFKYVLKCQICNNFTKCINCSDYLIDINKCPLHNKELKSVNNLSVECAKCNIKNCDFKCETCEYSICLQCYGIIDPYPNFSNNIQENPNNSLSKYVNYSLKFT